MPEEFTIYHFQNNADKRAALLTLVESGLIWKGVKSTGNDISVPLGMIFQWTSQVKAQA
jgi:hypothetical protein